LVVGVAIATVTAMTTVPAGADWSPGDGSKMHFPQMPDLDGWDVQAYSPLVLADDWRCTGSGPITDIHFWGSWKGGNTGQIESFSINIYSDDPVGPGGSDPANSYSKPDLLLWEGEFFDFGVVPVDPPTMQGWYNPATGMALPGDHQSFFQYNLVDIPNPCLQVAGEIYWLSISANVLTGQWGWKNADLDQYPQPYTGMHYLDDAVWSNLGTGWQELIDPLDFHSLDLAFVITPEPMTFVLLASGGLLLLRRRR